MSQGDRQERGESLKGGGVERERVYKPRGQSSDDGSGSRGVQSCSVQGSVERQEKEPKSQPRHLSTSQEGREEIREGELRTKDRNRVLKSDQKDKCDVFKVVYTNARSIVGKIDLLRAYVCELKPARFLLRPPIVRGDSPLVPPGTLVAKP